MIILLGFVVLVVWAIKEFASEAKKASPVEKITAKMIEAKLDKYDPIGKPVCEVSKEFVGLCKEVTLYAKDGKLLRYKKYIFQGSPDGNWGIASLSKVVDYHFTSAEYMIDRHEKLYRKNDITDHDPYDRSFEREYWEKYPTLSLTVDIDDHWIAHN